MDYHNSKTIDDNFENAIQRVTAALKEEGFGIITDIDIKQTFKQKLEIDFRKYRILGACNPAYAHRALSKEDMMGLFMPCNVIVQEHENGKIEVLIPKLPLLMQFIANDEIQCFADEVYAKLKQALNNI
jgi:uncharacterized protein (DUF302 family)